MRASGLVCLATNYISEGIMKLIVTLLAGLGQLFGMAAQAGETEARKTAKATMEVNQALSGKIATTYLRTSETPQSPNAQWKINQALSGKTAVVYVRVPQ
jgi:hypothetical protein